MHVCILFVFYRDRFQQISGWIIRKSEPLSFFDPIWKMKNKNALLFTSSSDSSKDVLVETQRLVFQLIALHTTKGFFFPDALNPFILPAPSVPQKSQRKQLHDAVQEHS